VTDWTQAACKSDPGFMHNTGLATAYARRVCGACPIRAACLRHALNLGEYRGIWGGMTGPERRRLAKRQQRPQPIRHDLIVHVHAGVEPFSALRPDEQVWLWRRHTAAGGTPSAFARRYRISGTTMRQVSAAAELDQPSTQHRLAA
jgi:hypothetical protein